MSAESTAHIDAAAHLQRLADPTIAEHSQRFFKTGPGQYGEGDVFLGIRVPVLRKLVKQYRHLDFADAAILLNSPHHEQRLFALLVLVRLYERADEPARDEIFSHYLGNINLINNWDLVDTTAPHIVGRHLHNRDRSILHELALSSSLWERRVAIISTFYFIRQGDFADTLAIATTLLQDGEDLIHKAVGWMLREIGKREGSTLDKHLCRYYRQMPRTMLRYAIERLAEPRRQAFLRGEVDQDK